MGPRYRLRRSRGDAWGVFVVSCVVAVGHGRKAAPSVSSLLPRIRSHASPRAIRCAPQMYARRCRLSPSLASMEREGEMSRRYAVTEGVGEVPIRCAPQGRHL